LAIPRQFKAKPGKARHRMTPSVARKMKTEALVENFENAANVLRQKDQFPVEVRLRAKRLKKIVRPELLRRGFAPEEIDYDSEAVANEIRQELGQIHVDAPPPAL
jgi:SOS response regulatory protein OraA/RecX